jgi:nucleoside-diphosphate-sugar epimerase
MKTVLVTGGAGYIGSVVTEQLLDAGHRVRVLDRLFFGRHLLAPLEKRDGLTIVKDDIRYVGPEVFEGVDVVMDLAGISNDPSADLAPGITEDINFGGAVHTGRLAKEAGVGRYIYSSSCSVYGHNGAESAYGNGNGHGNGNGNDHRLVETSPKAPVSLYAKTKIAAEDELLRMHDSGCTTTRSRWCCCGTPRCTGCPTGCGSTWSST